MIASGVTVRGAGVVRCNEWFYERKSRANTLSLKTGNSQRRHPGYCSWIVAISRQRFKIQSV